MKASIARRCDVRVRPFEPAAQDHAIEQMRPERRQGKNVTDNGDRTAAGDSDGVAGTTATATRQMSSTCVVETSTQPLASKHDCLKCLEELNRETALYSSIVVALGCTFDSDLLRLQLKNSRRRAYELAKQLKGHLLPHLRGNSSGREDLQQYEKLWITFISCLELVLTLLTRTLTLTRQFPLGAGRLHSLVNTGLTEPLTRHRFTHTVHGDTADVCSDATVQPADWENRLLRRDIRDMRDMLREMIETVDVQPWTIEPRIDASKFECKSLYSCSETSSTAEEVVSVEPDDHHRRRKCACLVSLVLLTVLVFATVLGACIALLA
ncbi:hypothetical protein NP493_960g01034 [Ridgeia piscesae]|uniref:Regulator of G-protein signaling 9-binding protein n=1 Tax=Ridgeia piscesae TaxID=27915 RepID=A0AAD9NMD2_RIDPI|nr:hypothetical protein NP493_960g01034 [Ridgeia piscesae]